VLSSGLGAASARCRLGSLHVGKPGQYANIKAPHASAGVGPPFAEFRDHEIATGSITADATSDLAGFMAPSAYAHRHRPSPSDLRPPTGIAARARENAVTLAEGKHLRAVHGSSVLMS
jgi:hypothetical protein